MPGSSDSIDMTPQVRLHELASILAAGFLRLKCRRGYIPDAPPDQPEPPTVAPHSVPEKAIGILRN
jgi:hypothetical protein